MQGKAGKLLIPFFFFDRPVRHFIFGKSSFPEYTHQEFGILLIHLAPYLFMTKTCFQIFIHDFCPCPDMKFHIIDHGTIEVKNQRPGDVFIEEHSVKAMPLSEVFKSSRTVACRNRDYQIILLLFEFNGLIITVSVNMQDVHTCTTHAGQQVYVIIT